MNPIEAARRVEAALDEVKRSARERHGWTYLEVRVELQAPVRKVVLEGEVVVHRLRRQLVESILEVLPGWEVDATAVEAMAGGTWHALPPTVTPLRARRPGPGDDDALATELRYQDGPVQCLVKGRGGDASVVRGRDGTVGWLVGPLGSRSAVPRLPMPWVDQPRPLIRGTSAWIDVPYRLGGVTEAGIDCSALVQRLAADILGVALPRHSTDQLHVAPLGGPGLEPGDLNFAWRDDEAPCHVGICTGLTIVHASSSRERVVADPLAVFQRGASRMMHVRFGEMVRFGQRVAGRASLVDAGFELGRPPPR